MNTTAKEIDLSDYIENARGHLVPRASIKPIDHARDELIHEFVTKARHASQILHDLKYSALGDIEAFIDLASEKYAAPLRKGKGKGNVTLTSFDGRYQIKRATQDKLAFDEALQAAKALIDDCFEEWTSESNKEIRTLITDAFQVDKEGDINVAKVLSLRRYNFDHPKWISAMEAIADALKVASTKTYVRIYERDDKTGKYNQIPLDIANV